MMSVDDLPRLNAVDRSEHITRQYVVVGDTLVVREVDIHAGPWDRTPEPGQHEHPQVAAWRALLERGGILLGAFEGADTLAGFALLLPELEPGLADLALLYVGAKHRGHGIGVRLCDEVVTRAREGGAERLYVSATPTVPTVDFYAARGFERTPTPHPAMFAAEPEDIHMVMDLEVMDLGG